MINLCEANFLHWTTSHKIVILLIQHILILFHFFEPLLIQNSGRWNNSALPRRFLTIESFSMLLKFSLVIEWLNTTGERKCKTINLSMSKMKAISLKSSSGNLLISYRVDNSGIRSKSSCAVLFYISISILIIFSSSILLCIDEKDRVCEMWI